MYYYIKGTLEVNEPTFAVIDACGIGYKLTVSQTTHDGLPSRGSQVKLFTHMSVREDGIELFGFLTQEELSAFRLLIGASGVGPKVAISILSYLSPEKFALAVSSEDKKTLSKASGVGAKTAARIILELKDKLGADMSFSDVSSVPDSAGASVTSSENLSDAIEALSVVGYTRSEILSALHGVDTKNMSVEEIFKAATKRLMRG